MESDEVERVLYEAIEIVREQSENPEPRFIRAAIRGSLRGAIRWVCSTDTRPTPDLEALSAEDAIEFLDRALILFQEHRADSRLVQDAKVRLRSTIEWVHDVEQLESRRTMPRTNVHPRPSNVIGYRYRERE